MNSTWNIIKSWREPSGRWLPPNCSTLIIQINFGSHPARFSRGAIKFFFYECLGHGSYFQIFIFVFFADPSWWLQMAPGAAQKSWILGKPLLWRLLEPSTCHVSKIFFQIWALTDLNILNPEGHICSHQGRTRPDGSNIWIFTSCSKFLQWLGGTIHMHTDPVSPVYPIMHIYVYWYSFHMNTEPVFPSMN